MTLPPQNKLVVPISPPAFALPDILPPDLIHHVLRHVRNGIGTHTHEQSPILVDTVDSHVHHAVEEQTTKHVSRYTCYLLLRCIT